MKSANLTPIVACVHTTAGSVVDDYRRLLELADCKASLGSSGKVVVKCNHSHNIFFPACSTPPWQLDGVLDWLETQGRGGADVLVTESPTVCTNLPEVIQNHGWETVARRHGTAVCSIAHQRRRRISASASKLRAHWGKVGGPSAPEDAFDATLVHLVPLKLHGHSVMTGAIKSLFSLFLETGTAHRMHACLAEALVDMLVLQGSALQARPIGVIDAAFVGDGKGPVTLTPRPVGLLLASRDLVALDAVAATLLGFRPRDIPYLALAEQAGLGTTDLDRMELRGVDVRENTLHCRTGRNLVIAADRLLRSQLGQTVSNVIFETPLTRLAIWASRIYHNAYWPSIEAPRHLRVFRQTEWGRLMEGYVSTHRAP